MNIIIKLVIKYFLPLVLLPVLLFGCVSDKGNGNVNIDDRIIQPIIIYDTGPFPPIESYDFYYNNNNRFNHYRGSNGRRESKPREVSPVIINKATNNVNKPKIIPKIEYNDKRGVPPVNNNRGTNSIREKMKMLN